MNSKRFLHAAAMRMVREHHNLKQAEMAMMLDVPQATVSFIESGRRLPTEDYIYKVSKRFDIDPAWIEDIESGKPPYWWDPAHDEQCNAAASELAMRHEGLRQRTHHKRLGRGLLAMFDDNPMMLAESDNIARKYRDAHPDIQLAIRFILDNRINIKRLAECLKDQS